MYVRGAGGFGFDQGFRRRYADDFIQLLHGVKVHFQRLLDQLAYRRFVFYAAYDLSCWIIEEIRGLGVFNIGSRFDCHAGLEIKTGK